MYDLPNSRELIEELSEEWPALGEALAAAIVAGAATMTNNNVVLEQVDHIFSTALDKLANIIIESDDEDDDEDINDGGFLDEDNDDYEDSEDNYEDAEVDDEPDFELEDVCDCECCTDPFKCQ
jgi:phosphopantothenoylcysteine synthetase/decarboxylase